MSAERLSICNRHEMTDSYVPSEIQHARVVVLFSDVFISFSTCLSCYSHKENFASLAQLLKRHLIRFFLLAVLGLQL